MVHAVAIGFAVRLVTVSLPEVEATKRSLEPSIDVEEVEEVEEPSAPTSTESPTLTPTPTATATPTPTAHDPATTAPFVHREYSRWDPRSWATDPRLLTGIYNPRGPRLKHPEDLPSRRIPRSILARVIEGNRGRFDVCRTVGLPSSAGLAGEIDVTFVIAPDGEVGEVQDTGGSFEDPTVRRCVVRTFGMLHFGPTPNGERQMVSYAMPWSDG
jgi:hypothetical protein